VPIIKKQELSKRAGAAGGAERTRAYRRTFHTSEDTTRGYGIWPVVGHRCRVRLRASCLMALLTIR
jgi:hypothetical protein